MPAVLRNTGNQWADYLLTNLEWVVKRTVWLRVSMLLAAVFVALLSQPAAAVTPSTPRATEGYIRHLGELINTYRQRNGLQPLAFAENLAELADEHSVDMAAQRKLSHDGFQSRARRTSSRVCVENVGWNYPTAETQFDGWRRSPTHDRNLLDPKVSRMGLAVTTRYVAFFACT